MSFWTAEYGYDQLQKKKATIAAAAGTNEATTRLRAIDTILYNVLGWDKLHVEAERHFRAVGYADYIFKDTRGASCLVVEAKKEDETFVLPGNKSFASGPVGF